MFIWDIQNIEVLNMYSRNLPRENKLRCQSWYRIKYWGNNITRTCFLSDYARWICNEMLYILFIHFNKIKKIRYEASPYIISGKVICLHIFFRMYISFVQSKLFLNVIFLSFKVYMDTYNLKVGLSLDCNI